MSNFVSNGHCPSYCHSSFQWVLKHRWLSPFFRSAGTFSGSGWDLFTLEGPIQPLPPPPEGLLQSSNLVGGSDSLAGHLISDLVIFLDVSEGWLLETNAFKIMALPKGETGGSDIKPTCLKLRLSGRAHVKIVCVLIWCSLLGDPHYVIVYWWTRIWPSGTRMKMSVAKVVQL